MKTKNIILIALIAVILLMAVGYAAFAQLLTINGTADITANWDVKIINIREGSLVGATSKTTPAVGNDNLSANFNVELKYPGASATYIITVENAGTINAILNSVNGIDTANAANPTDITFSIDATTNDTLNSGSTKDYVVTVAWNSDSESVPTVVSKSATISLNYLQNT